MLPWLVLVPWLSLILLTNCEGQPVEIVLARCREDIDWIRDSGYADITTVYEKCGSTSGPGHHIEQPNVGREGGTFLRHIVENYDKLAEWTVFSQAEKPTYGYSGHRLGGGHMMSNVQFKDYVEAGKTRHENPRFFVFTGVMLSEGDEVVQSLRQGYGEKYAEPDAEALQEKMCGTLADWPQWYKLPQWFVKMVEQMQAAQKAPLSRFDMAEVFNLLDVQPREGVTFFAQGARFAASREAIQARPKAYYAKLLAFMNHQDPWAGYYMEWLWYYILGGSDAPCGFEEHVVNKHLAWKAGTGKGRQDLMEAQAVSGCQQIIQVAQVETSIEDQLQQQLCFDLTVAQFSDVDHRITAAQIITTLSLVFNNAALYFESTLVYNFAGGSLTGRDLILQAAATITAAAMTVTSLTVWQTAAINAPLSISSGAVTLGNAPSTGIMTITSSASFVNVQISGQGTVRCRQRGKEVIFRFVVIVITITLDLTFTGDNRRTDLTSPSLTVTRSCGTVNAGTVALGSTNVLFLDLSCTATASGFTQYSNSVGTLTGSGGLLYLSGVSSSSKPTLISTWTGVTSTPIEIDNVAAGSYCVTVLVYGASSCASSWPVTFDSCPSGSCTLTGGVYSGDNSKCQAQFCQSGAGGDSGSDGALYGLIALVAIIPLAALIAFGVWYFYRSQEAAPAYAYQYPQPQHAYPTYPTAYPAHYPAAYPQAYYPQGATFMESYPLQQTPMPTPVTGFSRL
eukprot:EG_transcript_3941